MLLTSLDIDLTEACNMYCEYCYHYQDNLVNPQAFMSRDTAAEIVNFLIIPYKVKRVYFYGGEPLFAFGVLDYFVKECEDLSVKFTVISNLSILTDDLKKWFKANKVNIQSSIDGTRETQDRQRPLKGTNKSSDIVFKNSSKALSINHNGVCRMTVTKQSIPDYFKNVKFVLTTLGYRKCAPTIIPDKSLQDCDYAALEEQLEQTSLWAKKTGRTSSILTLLPRHSGGLYCTAGIMKVGISTDGGVYPCHRFTNVEQMRLGDIQHPKTWDMKYHTSSGKCSSCNACSGGCPYINFTQGIENGGLYEPPEAFCRIKRLERKYATL